MKEQPIEDLPAKLQEQAPQAQRPNIFSSKKARLFILLAVLFVCSGLLVFTRYHQQQLDLADRKKTQLEQMHAQYASSEAYYKAPLLYFSEQDRNSLHAAVDSATSRDDLDKKVEKAINKALDGVLIKASGSDYTPFFAFVPIINTSGISYVVKGSNTSTDVLANVNATYFTDAELHQVKEFAKIFLDEYTKYPVQWLTKLGSSSVEEIVIVKTVNSKLIPEKQGSYMAGLFSGVIFYTTDGTAQLRNQLIHHEIGHALDTVLYSQGKKTSDAEWVALNTVPYDANIPSSEYQKEHPAPGFVTGYARVNVDEDKAETYAYLFSKDRHAKLLDMIKSDAVLKSKAEYLEKAAEANVAYMNADYFNKYLAQN